MGELNLTDALDFAERARGLWPTSTPPAIELSDCGPSPARGARYNEGMEISRITLDPAIMGGKPCIRGMRVTVGTVLGLLASGHSHQRILEAYPYLEAQDIDAALAYAAWRLVEREETLVAP